jgi:hypothetical protein
MNLRFLLLAAFAFIGSASTPVFAQLIHVSYDDPHDLLLFKSDDASIGWNASGGFITQIEFTYDSNARVGALDPGRNFWRMRVENPEMGRNFTITLPLLSATTYEHSVSFAHYNLVPNRFLDVEFFLNFDSPIPNDGSLPKFPLPELAETEYTHSSFSFRSGNFPFNVDHLAEAYGLIDIKSINVTMTPIPEPSTYAFAALALVGVAIGLRSRATRFTERAPARRPTCSKL